MVVAALKEAFDRDRARMDLERSQMEAERARAEEALRAELRRQAAERALGQLRLIAVMAFALLMVSAALGVWMPGMQTLAPRILMGSGWMCGHRRARLRVRRMAARLGLDRRRRPRDAGTAPAIPITRPRARHHGCSWRRWR